MSVTRFVLVLLLLSLASCAPGGELPLCTQDCTVSKSWGVV